MKKALLFLAAAAACAPAFAQEAQFPSMSTPVIFNDAVITAISADGTYALSSLGPFGIVSLINRQTGQIDNYDSETGYYSAGYGTAVSNNGIIVGTTTESEDDASYCENGEWHFLPLADSDQGINTSHGITPDGMRICGQIGRTEWGPDATKVMQQPVIWNHKADGEGFDMYVELPFPDDDFFGTTPQYVTAVQISSDGKLVAGQIMCGSGFYTEPIYYVENADGTWRYLLPLRAFLQEKLAALPENPGDSPDEPNAREFLTAEEYAQYDADLDAYYAYGSMIPQRTDFMSPKEKAAYENALFAWENNLGPYPVIEDYMTEEEMAAYKAAVDEYDANYPQYPEKEAYMSPEELAAYTAAMEEYETAYNEWYEKNYEFETALEEASAEIPNFEFNAVCLSGNGRYLAYTASRVDWETGQILTPWIFDLQTGEHFVINTEVPLYATFLANDGTLLAASPADPYAARCTYVCENHSVDQITTLDEWIRPKNQNLYDWMDANMRHSYLEMGYDYILDDYVYIEHENEWVTGTAVATPDLKTIVSWTLNTWADFDPAYEDDPDSAPYFYSYILPLDYTKPSGGILGAQAELSVKALSGGVIEIAGHAASIAVYDVNGRLAFSADAPASTVATGLGSGMYVIKATDAAGNAVIAKAAF